jgi:hypothetical protein
MCLRCLQVALFPEKKRDFFIFFHAKNEKKMKKRFFSKKNGLTSGLTRA